MTKLYEQGKKIVLRRGRYSRGKTDWLDKVVVDSRLGELQQHDVILSQAVEGQAVVRVNDDLGHLDVLTTDNSNDLMSRCQL